MPHLAIKIRRSSTNEIRRFRIESKTGAPESVYSFDDLLVLTRNTFTNLPGPIKLTWTDSDGDAVTVSSDTELADAISFITPSQSSKPSLPLLRLVLHDDHIPADDKVTTATTVSKSSADPAISQAIPPAQPNPTPSSTVNDPEKVRSLLARRVAGVSIAKAQRSALQVGRDTIRQLHEQLRLARVAQRHLRDSFYAKGEFQGTVAALQGSAFALDKPAADTVTIFALHTDGVLTCGEDNGRWFVVGHNSIALRIPGVTDSLTLATLASDGNTLDIIGESEEPTIYTANRLKNYDPEPQESIEPNIDEPIPDFDICPPGVASKTITIRVPESLSSIVDGVDFLTPGGLLFPGTGAPEATAAGNRQFRHRPHCRGRFPRFSGRCGVMGQRPFISNRDRTCHQPVHFGFTCDASEMSPIVGTRYHKKGYDYDLCEKEFQKLPECEKAKYEAIFTNRGNPIPYGSPIHFGYTCDASEMSPIFGTRYHKKGCNYDLCEAEFQKLPEGEKVLFEIISHRGARPVPFAKQDDSQDKPNSASTPSVQPTLSSTEPNTSNIYPNPSNEGSLQSSDQGWVAVDPRPQTTPEEIWAKELGFLADMGFTNCEEHLIELLEANKGDCNTVINKLMA